MTLVTGSISILQKQEALPAKYRDHQLTNSKEYKDVRECHIEPDWLLIYRVKDEVLILELSRTGSHSDLFNEKSKEKTEKGL